MNNQKLRTKLRSQLRLIKLLFCAAVLCVYSLTSHRATAFSSGPPASQTGAPGETTCVSCHFSFPLNSGGGTFAITGLPATYSSDQEVDITITLTQSNRARYGFQVTALTDSEGQAGTFVVTDSARTQPVTGGGRTYVEHTFGGTTPSAANQGSWTFRNFDPNRLRFTAASPGREMGRATFVINTERSEDGRIGILLTLAPGQRLPSGVRSLMAIHFSAVADGLLSDAQVVFGDYPVAREIADAEANLLPASFEGTVSNPDLIRTIRECSNKIRQEDGRQENRKLER